MLEHLTAKKRQNFGPGECKFRVILNRLEPNDQVILEDCMTNRDEYSTHGIWQGLRSAGIHVGYTTLSRHREGLCAGGVTDA